jgi:hypothetical protein
MLPQPAADRQLAALMGVVSCCYWLLRCYGNSYLAVGQFTLLLLLLLLLVTPAISCCPPTLP